MSLKGGLSISKDSQKIVRKAQKKIPWISQVIEKTGVALDLYPSINLLDRSCGGSQCHLCKGSRLLCGKSSCPLMARLYAYLKAGPLLDKDELAGDTPPGVFVGRIGYPYVYAGPMVPPIFGDTEVMDLPELWFGKSMDEILDLRFKLVRGKFRVDVRKPDDSGRLLDETRELALMNNSVETALKLSGRPRHTLVLGSQIQPMGPSARVERMRVGNGRVNRSIERAYYDSDLRAVEAVKEIYDDGIPVSKIQRGFSMGLFGVRDQRRLVPTRWSITAVDSLLSKEMIHRIKYFPRVNEYLLYESTYLDNRFEILMIPESWKYESMEAWYPGTIWNPTESQIFMLGDSESYHGRRGYARMGGCYYAARLAVNEKLCEERRQATVLVLREAHPGYIMPVGVWQVRENVRNALRSEPMRFDALKPALERIRDRLDIDLGTWIENSEILRDALTQTKITSFT